MARNFTWQPAPGGPAGRYEKVPIGSGSSSGARPQVEGVSGSRAPGSAAEPCPLGTIRVTVLRSDSKQGISGATVTAGGGQKRTSGDGAVAFEKIQPGPYVVMVELPPADPLKFRAPPSCEVHLEASATAAVTVLVDPLATLKVKLKDEESGKGVEGARIGLVDTAGSEVAAAATRNDGVATLTGLDPGTYTVKTSLGDTLEKRYEQPRSLPKTVLGAGETKAVELVASPLGAQKIKLLKKPASTGSGKSGGAAKPYGNARIALKSAKDQPVTAETDQSGVAIFEGLTPGDYTITLDLGADAGRFRPYSSEQITIKGSKNADKTIELEVVSCQLRRITVKEILGKAEDGGIKEKVGRTFVMGGDGGAKPAGAIEVKDGAFLSLVAPRKSDLFKTEPASLTPLPYNPATSALKKGVGPTWLEIELDASAHAVAPEQEPGHPVLIVQSGASGRVVDGKGAVKSGRFMIWGPEFPWQLLPPSEKGKWLKKVGFALSELLNGFTKRAIAPAYWDLFLTHCDDEGNPAETKTTLAVFPGDVYQLKLNIPAVRGWSYGVNGDYIEGEKVTKSSSEKSFGGTVTATEEKTSAEGTETKETSGRTEVTTKADGTTTVDEKTVFAGLFEGEYGAEPLINFTRNGQSNPLGSDLVMSVIFASTEAVKWFSELGNLTPKWGWWITADIALLKVSISADWGWQAKEKANEVNWVYVVKIAGTLFELKLGIKAGLEGTVVPSLVYFRAVIYLEVAGSLDAEWTWASDKRPTKQNVSSTASLELGVDIVIGNANFCQAKAWVKVPYTFQWNILPADLNASPPRDKWDVEFKHGCKDGIYVVAKYKLFYGKYEGTKKIYLKDKVELD